MGGAVPLLVSFGTGLVSRYNQRKKAQSAAEYEQVLLDAKNKHESTLLTEERDHEFAVTNHENQLDINNILAEQNFEKEILDKENQFTKDAEKREATQANLDRLQKLKDDKSLLKYEDTLASAANAVASLNGFEVFGNGDNSFKLNQWPSADGNPEVGHEWDLKKMEELNNLADNVAGFKDRVLKLDDTELARFQTYATNLFGKFRLSNAKKRLDTGAYLAFARIKPNKNGKGNFQHLFDTEKFPEILGLNQAHLNSTNYIRSIAFEDAKKSYSKISDVLTKSDEDGTYDYILPLDDITKLYPNVPLEEIFAAAQIVSTYNPELVGNEEGMNKNMEIIYSLKDRPTDLIAARYANTFDRTGSMKDGMALVQYWNDHPEAYGTKDGYVMQEDGTMFYEGIDHEARLDSLALGVRNTLIGDNDPAFITVLDSDTGVEEAQKRLVSSEATTIGEIKSTATQGINAINIMNNILTTYDPKHGGSALTGGMLSLEVLIEGVQSQIELLGEAATKSDAKTFFQQVYVDNKLGDKSREAINTFEYKGQTLNVLDAMYQDKDFDLQVEAQRKFFATALNYSVSMILQGGTGGKTISDTDYEIMEKSMYNGLFTSKGLNLSALEAIYKTVRLPSIVAQYKTNLDSANAIQNMQAAVKYEKLINYGGIQTYRSLTKQLNGYSSAEAETTSIKNDYFTGSGYPGKATISPSPRKEEVDGKTIVYTMYSNGTKMPMQYSDLAKHFKSFASTIKEEDYLEFENSIFDTYRNFFGETLNPDAGNERIVKDIWKETMGVNPNKLP
jgi:hypothetical protein|tara:strand:+ start:327 stop:2696 length:2370 start_codon:yes stop_codon:yes gene_type:complete